jgi:hypothetical protein
LRVFDLLITLLHSFTFFQSEHPGASLSFEAFEERKSRERSESKSVQTEVSKEKEKLD